MESWWRKNKEESYTNEDLTHSVWTWTNTCLETKEGVIMAIEQPHEEPSSAEKQANGGSGKRPAPSGGLGESTELDKSAKSVRETPPHLALMLIGYALLAVGLIGGVLAVEEYYRVEAEDEAFIRQAKSYEPFVPGSVSRAREITEIGKPYHKNRIIGFFSAGVLGLVLLLIRANRLGKPTG